MSTAENTVRQVPAAVYQLPLNERWKWAREKSRLSHDRIVEIMGRSNRSHLIKIEKGDHVPRQDLRDDYADAVNVPRDLFADEQEEAPTGDPFRGSAPAAPPRRGRQRGGRTGEAGEVAA